MGDEQAGIDPAQVEPLAARQHGHRHLADLGGGEDEFCVRRRLFQRLQERIERSPREHVHLIENIHLRACAYRRVPDRIIDLAHVIDAIVGGGVHLDDIDVPAFHDGLAVHAEDRHFDHRTGDGAIGQLVVERPGKDARGRRFAHSAHAGENPGLRDAAGLECV